MNAPAKLGLYAVGLLALFAIAFAGGRAFIPAGTSAAWAERADANQIDHGAPDPTGAASRSTSGVAAASPRVPGLSIEDSGYQASTHSDAGH